MYTSKYRRPKKSRDTDDLGYLANLKIFKGGRVVNITGLPATNF
jgi:hypothetical protein